MAIQDMARAAKQASILLAAQDSLDKDIALKHIAEALRSHREAIVQAKQEIVGDEQAQLPHVGLIVRPGLAEDPHGGPLDALDVADPLCGLQPGHVRFGPDRLDLGDLPEDLQRPLVQAEAIEVDADVWPPG